jgi:NAD(P)-dependent dehydrogenase (short-subunit alcohol dehydrogenase family)
MKYTFKGDRALVTGAGSGIGEATARLPPPDPAA